MSARLGLSDQLELALNIMTKEQIQEWEEQVEELEKEIDNEY